MSRLERFVDTISAVVYGAAIGFAMAAVLTGTLMFLYYAITNWNN